MSHLSRLTLGLGLVLLALWPNSVWGQSVMATAGETTPGWAAAYPIPEQTTTPVSATDSNPPTPGPEQTLNDPSWGWTYTAEMSQDGVNWTPAAGFSASFDSPNTSTANLIATFLDGAYWRFHCKATVSYSDSGGNQWSGNGTADALPKSLSLVTLIVTGATNANVVGTENFAAVKVTTSTFVVVEATIKPNTEDAAGQITWTGGDPVTGTLKQRQVSKQTSAKTEVIATYKDTERKAVIWIIWADVTIAISGWLSPGNNAANHYPPFTPADLTWAPMFGGGNTTGVIDHDGTPALTFAYTLGRIEAKAVLSPAGIENVVDRTKWKFRRSYAVKAWDNAASSADFPAGTDDTSKPGALDIDPKSGTSTREIYDTDTPGCSVALTGITINHTSELYVNFTQWVTVTLDAEAECSDFAPWSYRARVDGDKAVGQRVELNVLDISHYALPATPYYAAR